MALIFFYRQIMQAVRGCKTYAAENIFANIENFF